MKDLIRMVVRANYWEDGIFLRWTETITYPFTKYDGSLGYRSETVNKSKINWTEEKRSESLLFRESRSQYDEPIYDSDEYATADEYPAGIDADVLLYGEANEMRGPWGERE